MGWRFWRRESQVSIDALIDANRAKPREGMERVDTQKLNRAGERTWHEKLRGQRRYTGTGSTGRLVKFK